MANITYKRSQEAGVLEAHVEGQTNPLLIERNTDIANGTWGAYSVRMSGKKICYATQKEAKAGIAAYANAFAAAL